MRNNKKVVFFYLLIVLLREILKRKSVKMTIIEKSFYSRNTLDVAKSLLGCILCKKMETGDVLRGIIVETEAYTQEDPACHAFRGITKRSSTLFKAPGLAYVYLIYGMYNCVNVVTEKEGRGCAVLIRALEPIGNFTGTNGPGKLCRVMGITRELNEIDLTSSLSELWIEYGKSVSKNNIISAPRIGIKVGVDLKWRFYIKNNQWVSKV